MEGQLATADIVPDLPSQTPREPIRESVPRANAGDHTGEVMKLFKVLASPLFVATLCMLAVPGAAGESAVRLPARISSLSIFITLAVLCLVVGLGLRAFSKPPADLSINQTKK